MTKEIDSCSGFEDDQGSPSFYPIKFHYSRNDVKSSAKNVSLMFSSNLTTKSCLLASPKCEKWPKVATKTPSRGRFWPGIWLHRFGGLFPPQTKPAGSRNHLFSVLKSMESIRKVVLSNLKISIFWTPNTVWRLCVGAFNGRTRVENDENDVKTWFGASICSNLMV